MAEPKLCHCGKPLHYTDPAVRAIVEELIERLGESIKVTDLETGISYEVPRHFLALHGLKQTELAKLGFRPVGQDEA